MTTRKQLTFLILSFGLFVTATAYTHANGQQPEAVFIANISPVLRTNSLTPMMRNTDAHATADSVTERRNTEALQAPQVRLNPAAVTYVQQYLKKNNEVLQKVEERSKPVFRIMEPILEKYNLPTELKYLAVVESDLIRTAVSRVGAAGPWQLMPATARELGLKVTKKYDERKQYHKSTTAAAKYLRDLYKTYGDWLLVIAAYNAGPGVINKAIRRSGSHNFWKLQHFLPAETRGHVKRFISTHYFFEQAGGETTLTKAENIAHAKRLEAFTALQQLKTEAAKPITIALTDVCIEQEPVKETTVEMVAVTKEK